MSKLNTGHIFVSYKSTDKSSNGPLVELLERQGWTVWWDRKIPPGKTFDQVIEEAITAADCLVVVWSKDSVASDWVKTEASEGVRRGILVPVLIDDVAPPLEFRRIQAAKLAGLPRPVDDPEVQGLLVSVAKTVRGEEEKRAPGSTPELLLGDSPSTILRRRKGASPYEVTQRVPSREPPSRPETTAPAPSTAKPEEPVSAGQRWGGGRVRLAGVAALVSLIAAASSYFVLAGSTASDMEKEISGEPGAMTFIGVDIGGDDSEADAKLVDYLRGKAALSISSRLFDYETVVEKLTDWDPADGTFLARTTPYVYVAAEMLGADLEVLATYRSRATESTTYHSYFVVNRRDFPDEPTLEDVLSYLQRQREQRPRFIYHSKFSTSSYFLPSLYFRDNNVFFMRRSTEALVAINSRQIDGDSSSELVHQVARGEADLAAVWDGTRTKFEPGGPKYEEYGRHVRFIRIDTLLPNDLLVCSASLAKETKHKIRDAVAAMEPDEGSHIGVGDFLWWQDWRAAVDARKALSALRWSATGALNPVTVEVRGAEGKRRPPKAYLEAAAQAVRLSGTELVLFDPDFHQHADFVWSLEAVHDGALRLTSKVKGISDGDLKQEHWVSFAGREELAGRLSDFIHSQMHRIRYLWPYASDEPTLIRDVGFSLPAGTRATVQKIVWLDPEHNKITEGRHFETRVNGSDFNKLTLDDTDFARAKIDFRSDPLSNVAYRVVLVRPSRESPVLRGMTFALVALLVLAAAGAVLDCRRRAGYRAGAKVRARVKNAADALADSGLWVKTQTA